MLCCVAGILVSVKNRADQNIHKLKESYDHLVQRATELQERCDKLVIPRLTAEKPLRVSNLSRAGLTDSSLSPSVAGTGEPETSGPPAQAQHRLLTPPQKFS